MILLNQAAILDLLDNKTVDITLVQSIASTNNAFDTHHPTEKFSVCLAEEQTLGRGQFQRTWHSPFAENIYLSLCYYSSNTLASLSGLSLVVGYAICKVLNTLFILDTPACIKWPNDILYAHSKIAGLLIETKKMSNETHRIIIGIGLNVNMQHADSVSISQPWTSLRQLTGTSQDRNMICAQLINQICAFIPVFEKNGFSDFAPLWNQHNAFSNKILQINHNQATTVGKCMGVSPQAELILQLENGERKYFSSGEVSLHVDPTLYSNVELWFLDYAKLSELSYDWSKLISTEELQRANRFHFENDKLSFIIYHACKRLILSHYLRIEPKDIVISLQEKGKPFLKDAALTFNLSHTKEMAVLAIASRVDIGVDIEKIKTSANYLDIAKRFFHPEEYQQLLNIENAEKQQETFFILWTAKEAILKATGEGISAGLDSFCVQAMPTELTHTYLRTMALIRLKAPPTYIASLAALTKNVSAVYRDIFEIIAYSFK